MKKRDDDTLVVVSDFRANGPTRGSLNPILGVCGEVLQPRQQNEPAPEQDFSPPPNLQPHRRTRRPTKPKPKRPAATKPPTPKRRHVQALLSKERAQLAIDRKRRREQKEQRHKLRHDLWMSYGYGSKTPRLGQGEYFVGVYQSTPGELVVSPCTHSHFGVMTAIWCHAFPADRPPTHVVVASERTSRVVRSLTKKG